jgi:hypothetical protein
VRRHERRPNSAIASAPPFWHRQPPIFAAIAICHEDAMIPPGSPPTLLWGEFKLETRNAFLTVQIVTAASSEDFNSFARLASCVHGHDAAPGLEFTLAIFGLIFTHATAHEEANESYGRLRHMEGYDMHFVEV